MQCYTFPSLSPRTSVLNDYRQPPDHYYKKRPHYIPEPDKNGRMFAPDAFKLPLPFRQPNMVYEPIDPKHRSKKMLPMLEHINKVNWTTSQDAWIRPAKPKPRQFLGFQHSTTMPTVTNTTYVDHGNVPVDRKVQTTVPSIGIMPCAYPLPYTKERTVFLNDLGCRPALYVKPDIFDAPHDQTCSYAGNFL